jgi:hypothetical protein
MRFNIAEEKERKRIYTEGAEGTEFTENRSEDLTASEWLATVDILTFGGFRPLVSMANQTRVDEG